MTVEIERSVRLTDNEQDMLITILWDRIKSRDFKDFIISKYDVSRLDLRQLLDLILIHEKTFDLRIFKFKKQEYR